MSAGEKKLGHRDVYAATLGYHSRRKRVRSLFTLWSLYYSICHYRREYSYNILGRSTDNLNCTREVYSLAETRASAEGLVEGEPERAPHI